MTSGVAAPRHRYVALDSLRGISACIVVLYHVLVDSAARPVPFVQHGWLFVDFFFVLSGFVIAASYGERLAQGYSLLRYMMQRFFRIYPLHLFMLTIYLAFEIGFALLAPGSASRRPFEGIYSLESLASSFFLVQIFTGPDDLPWNGPSWSIAAEFWTYLLFALAMKARPRLIVPLCVLTAFAAPLYLAMLTDRNISVFHDGALVRCLYGFAVGVLCWKLSEHIRAWSPPRWADHAMELGAVLGVVLFVTMTGIDMWSLAAPLVFVLAVGIFSRERGVVSQLLLFRPLVAVGTLSYSIYLIHWFLLWRFINVMGVAERITGLDLVATRVGKATLNSDPPILIALTALFLAGVVLLAWFSHRFIEQPGIRLGRKLATPRDDDTRPAVVAPSGVAA